MAQVCRQVTQFIGLAVEESVGIALETDIDTVSVHGGALRPFGPRNLWRVSFSMYFT
jgi:hypothetical protein